MVFNNCYRDYAHVNARQLEGLFGRLTCRSAAFDFKRLRYVTLRS